MPSAPADLEAAEELVTERPAPLSVVRKSFVRGFAILLPLVITLLVVSFVVGFFADAISPLVTAIVGTSLFESRLVVGTLTLFLFVLFVVAIGLIAEYGPPGTHLNEQFDEFMSSVPGIGSVYTSFNEMSELLLDSDTDSFQEVKLVEYPGEDSYVVAFKTAETPDVIADSTDNQEMITLFMPMAPNPVMGGFVIHVSRERVVDIDLTVEQGIRSIVTSGVAVSDQSTEGSGLDETQMRELASASSGDETDDHSGTAESDKRLSQEDYATDADAETTEDEPT
jgi:uncharacterized membrane protein